MFLFSVLASVVGVVFLTLSMADVVQSKLGKLSCGSNHTFMAIISLSVIVLISLLIYLPSRVHAMYYCMYKHKILQDFGSKDEQAQDYCYRPLGGNE